MLKILEWLFPEGVKSGVAKDFRTLSVVLCAFGVMATYGKAYVDDKHGQAIDKIASEVLNRKEVSQQKDNTIKSVLKGYHDTIITELRGIKTTQDDLKQSQIRMQNRMWELSHKKINN